MSNGSKKAPKKAFSQSKPFEYPQSVYPAGVEFKVFFKKLKGEYGVAIGHEQTIHLDSTHKFKPFMKTVLFHEYLHALFHVTGVAEHMTPEQEESLVIMLSSQLSHLIDIDKLGKKP
jgi:hypothetical protein